MQTPFYTINGEYNTVIPGVLSEFKSNYTSYDIFCLNTRLLPLAKDYLIEYSNVLQGDKLVLYVVIKPKKIDEKIDLSHITDQGTRIINIYGKIPEDIERNIKIEMSDVFSGDLEGYCLLSDFSIGLPKKYVKDMISYLSFDCDYIIRDKKIYINLSKYVNYDEIYNSMLMDFVDKMKKFYSMGLIKCDEMFAQDMDLIRVKEDLYMPTWKSSFIDDITDLLYRIKNQENVRLYIGDFTGAYKYIAENIGDNFIIDNGFLIMRINNFLQLFYILRVIKDAPWTYTDIGYTDEKIIRQSPTTISYQHKIIIETGDKKNMILF